MIAETTIALRDLFCEQVEENTELSAGSIVEISELPVIVLNGPTLSEKKRLMRDAERIVAIDEEAGQAVREIPPRWYDLKFDVNISCESYPELIELFEKLSRLNQKYYLLTARNEKRERQYVWRFDSPPQVTTDPNISQVSQGRAGITIYDVEVYSEIQEVYSLIREIEIGINRDKIEVRE